MFLRAIKRKKDGKVHHYWSVVENVRVGRRVFQRRALYLGELNDSQHAEWQKAIEAIDENGRVTQLKLFPEERAPKSDDGSIVRIQMNRLSVGNMRNWGEALQIIPNNARYALNEGIRLLKEAYDDRAQ